MSTITSGRGKAVLMIAHVAGMIDLVALPVWVGTLVQHYHYDFKRAGMTVTCFLLGVVAASLLAGPRFHRLPRRWCAVAGYALSALGFLMAAATTDSAALLGLHVVAGAGTGLGLSMTHGAIGRSPNPHRLFAMAGAALGVFAVLFYAIVPPLTLSMGGSVLFLVMGGLMALAALAALDFPCLDVQAGHGARVVGRMAATAWIAIGGVACMALNQAIIFSFLERIGVTRGFGQDRVNGVLVVIGLINLVPAVLAAVLQQRLAATRVACIAPLVQAVLAVTIALSPTFGPYAAAASMFAFVLIFTHTFLFGLLARLDPGGRAVALTPAMLMAGSAIGPGLAGLVAQQVGFEGLGMLAVLVAFVASACFIKVSRTHQG